jgi:hypothetical protein
MFAVSGIATTGADALEVTSQTAAMLIRVVPTVLLTSARGNRHFVIGRVMANILVRVLKIKNVMTYASSRGLAPRARSAH